MDVVNHILGFPRIGANRELKFAQEQYWSGKISQVELLNIGKKLRNRHWKMQRELGINLISVGDFSWYDHVLTMSMMLGNIPKRHQNIDGSVSLDTLFYMARGIAPNKNSVSACEMTKWFDTNYHYIVPEFTKEQDFKLSWNQLFDEIDESMNQGHSVKPVILGPMTYLWLGKIKDNSFNRLELLPKLLKVYKNILQKIRKRGIEWVQIDEPILVLDLSSEWIDSFRKAYNNLQGILKLLLTTYFGSINHNLHDIVNFPIQGLHIDLVHGKYDLSVLNQKIPSEWILSLGIINGRNIWKANLNFWYEMIQGFSKFRNNIWIGSSCSLLHSPVDLNLECNLSLEIKNWFSFALQKCHELNLLTLALRDNNSNILNEWTDLLNTRLKSKIINNDSVKNQLMNITLEDKKRNSDYIVRSKLQKLKFNFPLLPTTTIGSFPQTNDIRSIRLKFKTGEIDFNNYQKEIKKHIQYVIQQQELLDIDVLVHGEPERNDMVEYFGEHLKGFAFTDHGWVQSYGSRCVKPPIIFGDVYRENPITIEWSKYAQSLTKKPVKAMLTGPITILCWSFIREDLSKQVISNQIALALRDEVLDLEKSGINIIQIDEPALREGLPLRKSDWKNYLFWATQAFKISSSKVKDTTQIHTHMCYCEFHDIMDAIVQLDADVITIETARSHMDLLEFFKDFEYPNEIGPGVYDIHSPNIPSVEQVVQLLERAIEYIPISRLWVNPDCGLKTRNWKETVLSLKNMIIATKKVRKQFQTLII